jgi:hypothetical protein
MWHDGPGSLRQINAAGGRSELFQRFLRMGIGPQGASETG